ncbi:hypothetical protein C0Q70_13549 [Pomacea canaliculata]|uniref:G-protein coupled receptors family 1 profile domain-containing protein n=1 Tax=Pomacea canaliculata TaxID=400727 RepID=A0A2T7NXJ1_POMCA|nr:hypothetical protein C0Q70_13549 [Pomacea canaliculata]
MLSSSHATTLAEEVDRPAITLSYEHHVPAGCVLGRSDGYKPWDNPDDLISHKAQKYLKTSTMAWVILVTSVFLVGAIALTAGYKHIFICVFDVLTNQTSQVQGFTNFFLDNKFAFEIIGIFNSILFTIVLLFVMIITTVLTIIKLYQAARWRQQNGAVSVKTSSETTEARKGPSQLSSKEEAITKMLVVASILFIVCLSPVVMVQISVFTVSELSYSGRYYNTISVLWEIIVQLRMVSCSLNFIIYCRMGSRFRSTLREILRCKYDYAGHAPALDRLTADDF